MSFAVRSRARQHPPCRTAERRWITRSARAPTSRESSPTSLRRAREFDHSVQLGCPLARMPRQTQGNAVPIRQAQARAIPESIGAEVEISVSEPETLLRNDKALPARGASRSKPSPNIALFTEETTARCRFWLRCPAGPLLGPLKFIDRLKSFVGRGLP